MKKFISIIALALIVNFAFAQDKPAYKLFDQKGKDAKYSKMIKDLQTADIVFFGEHHTDPISHWLQFEVTKDLHAVKKSDLMLGAEMFEADQQLVLDEYLDSAFAEDKFIADARLWGNYKTDYKPVVDFARENGLRYIATNIPRRYASMINKKGFEALDELSDEAKKYIGPALVELYDPEVACYKNMLDMFKEAGHSEDKKMPGMPGKSASTDKTKKMPAMHTSKDTLKTAKEMPKKDAMKSAMKSDKMMKGIPNMDNFPKSQAAKDATMAHFILKNWTEGKLFIHFEGAYHSANFEGIVWWINKLKPGLNIKTISAVNQEEIVELEEENVGKGSYIFAVPETMTQTNRK